MWYSVSDEAGGGLFAFHLSMIMNHSLYGGTHDHDALFRCGVMRAMMMCGKKKMNDDVARAAQQASFGKRERNSTF